MPSARSDYLGVHAGRYRRVAAGQEPGWSTPDETRAMLGQVRRALDLPSAPRRGHMLELGCGDACLTVELAQDAAFCIAGMDIVPVAIALGRARAAEAGLALDLRAGNVLALPWSDEQFDVVVDGHCLHCIVLGDRRRLFSEVARVLRPGGVFVILSMVGEPHEGAVGTFDPATRCLVHDGVASRYFATVDGLHDEVAAAGLAVEAAWPYPAARAHDNDELVVVARKV